MHIFFNIIWISSSNSLLVNTSNDVLSSTHSLENTTFEASQQIIFLDIASTSTLADGKIVAKILQRKQILEKYVKLLVYLLKNANAAFFKELQLMVGDRSFFPIHHIGGFLSHLLLEVALCKEL